MSSLAERLRSLRWMAVPIAAYLVITLALPIANGAAGRGDFARTPCGYSAAASRWLPSRSPVAR